MNTAPLPLQHWAPVLGPRPHGLPPAASSPASLHDLELHGERCRRWIRLVGQEHPEPARLEELPPLNRMTDRQRFDFEWQPASALSEAQFTQLFGGDGWKLKELADKRGHLRVGDLTQLRGDHEGLEAVRTMMLERPDLEIGDLVKRKRDGATAVDPSLYHAQSRQLLIYRHDLKPLELTHMGATFSSWLRNPALAHEAYLAALDLLGSRTTIRPKELEQMLGSMIQGVGGPGKAQTPKGGAAVVDMFKHGAQLLKKRPDLRPHDVAEMARETGKLAGKEAGDEGPGLVAQAFRTSCRALERAPHLQVHDVTAASKVMRKHFPGQDGKATQDRVRAFETGVDLMADHPGLKPEHLDGMLTRARQNQPGLQGIKLLTAFEGLGRGVANGTARLETVADPRARRGQPGDLFVDRFGRTQAGDRETPRPAPAAGRTRSERSSPDRHPPRQGPGPS